MSEKESFYVWRACNKLRAAAFRVGVDLLQYFKDLDLKCDGLITDNQFTSVLGGPLKKILGLCDQEISVIKEYFRVPDGRILYLKFCEVINGQVPNFSQNSSLSTGLEWNDPCHMNQLSQYEERKVKILLSKIAALLSVNCMLLRPYFQDYEMIAKGKGTITITHFARVLNFLGLKISSEDFQLLIKKFLKDSFTINYVAFISALSDVGECVDKYKVKIGLRASHGLLFLIVIPSLSIRFSLNNGLELDTNDDANS